MHFRLIHNWAFVLLLFWNDLWFFQDKLALVYVLLYLHVIKLRLELLAWLVSGNRPGQRQFKHLLSHCQIIQHHLCLFWFGLVCFSCENFSWSCINLLRCLFRSLPNYLQLSLNIPLPPLWCLWFFVFCWLNFCWTCVDIWLLNLHSHRIAPLGHFGLLFLLLLGAPGSSWNRLLHLVCWLNRAAEKPNAAVIFRTFPPEEVDVFIVRKQTHNRLFLCHRGLFYNYGFIDDTACQAGLLNLLSTKHKLLWLCVIITTFLFGAGLSVFAENILDIVLNVHYFKCLFLLCFAFLLFLFNDDLRQRLLLYRWPTINKQRRDRFTSAKHFGRFLHQVSHDRVLGLLTIHQVKPLLVDYLWVFFDIVVNFFVVIFDLLLFDWHSLLLVFN